MSARVLAFVLACAWVSASAGNVAAAPPSYDVEQAVALAQAQNPDIAIARKKVIGAHGGLIEARSGFLPSLTSTGLYDKRQQQSQS
jgi:outer membrane protein TolC